MSRVTSYQLINDGLRDEVKNEAYLWVTDGKGITASLGRNKAWGVGEYQR